MADQIQIVDQPTAEQVTQTSEPLLRLRAVFPFDLFHEEIYLDRYKVDVIKNDFFLTKRVITLPLGPDMIVRTNAGPLFASVTVTNIKADNQSVTVNYLLVNEALRFRQLVEGLVIGIRQGINFMKMSHEEVIQTAEKLGMVEENL